MNKNKWPLVVLIIFITVMTYILLKSSNPIPVVTTELPIETETEAPQSENKTLAIKLFFPNSIQDPGFMDCRVVRPSERMIPYTQGVATATINELIKGLTPEEINNGFVTQIDPDTTIKSLTVTDGVARIDLSKALSRKNVGLCAGQFIKAQIEETLLQFPTIDRVIVSIDGDAEFVQP